jgi:hypothetical protein
MNEEETSKLKAKLLSKKNQIQEKSSLRFEQSQQRNISLVCCIYPAFGEMKFEQNILTL